MRPRALLPHLGAPRQEGPRALGYIRRDPAGWHLSRCSGGGTSLPATREVREVRLTPSPSRRARRTSARLALVLAAVSLLTSGCSLREAYENTLSLGFPTPVTDQGRNVYELWLGTAAAGAVVGAFVWGLIGYAGFRYRKRSEDIPRQVRYNLPIEVLYTVVPFVVIAVLFYYTVIC